MGRPYGTVKRGTRKLKAPSGGDAAFKVRLRGKDGAPLSMQEIRDGLYETVRRLQKLDGVPRAKWVTIYLTMIDGDGTEVLPDASGTWDIFPYKSAADENGA